MQSHLLYLLFPLILMNQQMSAQSPDSMKYSTDKKFNNALSQIIKKTGLDSTYKTVDGDETISFAVIDLNGEEPVFGSVHASSYIYPASVYKMYVAMEVLKQASEGQYSIYQP